MPTVESGVLEEAVLLLNPGTTVEAMLLLDTGTAVEAVILLGSGAIDESFAEEELETEGAAVDVVSF